ncbi:hypothetical protein TNCV_2162071 [Trichonephila clavipes]|nr:hypothetical protein TNCV_2162071 [Trichonephila clavipes]
MQPLKFAAPGRDPVCPALPSAQMPVFPFSVNCDIGLATVIVVTDRRRKMGKESKMKKMTGVLTRKTLNVPSASKT